MKQLDEQKNEWGETKRKLKELMVTLPSVSEQYESIIDNTNLSRVERLDSIRRLVNSYSKVGLVSPKALNKSFSSIFRSTLF